MIVIRCGINAGDTTSSLHLAQKVKSFAKGLSPEGAPDSIPDLSEYDFGRAEFISVIEIARMPVDSLEVSAKRDSATVEAYGDKHVIQPVTDIIGEQIEAHHK